MFVYIRSAAFVIVVTQKLVLQKSKNVTAKCTETLSPPPSIQYLLDSAIEVCLIKAIQGRLCYIFFGGGIKGTLIFLWVNYFPWRGTKNKIVVTNTIEICHHWVHLFILGWSQFCLKNFTVRKKYNFMSFNINFLVFLLN